MQNQMCEVCHRQAAQDYWNALVQVRQKVHNCIPTEVVQKKLCWGSQSRNVLMAGASFVFKNERRCYILVLLSADHSLLRTKHNSVHM